MNGEQHRNFYLTMLGILAVLNYAWLKFIPVSQFWIFFTMIPLFLIDPDRAELLLGSQHRSFLTHSAILPLLFYLPIRVAIGSNPCINYPLITLMFFMPVLSHLLGDFKLSTIMGALAGDVKEKLIDGEVKPGSDSTVSKWRITMRPYIKFTFSFYQTIVWIAFNILFMIGFISYQFIYNFPIC